jgi:hypothetical protein
MTDQGPISHENWRVLTVVTAITFSFDIASAGSPCLQQRIAASDAASFAMMRSGVRLSSAPLEGKALFYRAFSLFGLRLKKGRKRLGEEWGKNDRASPSGLGQQGTIATADKAGHDGPADSLPHCGVDRRGGAHGVREPDALNDRPGEARYAHR